MCCFFHDNNIISRILADIVQFIDFTHGHDVTMFAFFFRLINIFH